MRESNSFSQDERLLLIKMCWRVVVFSIIQEVGTRLGWWLIRVLSLRSWSVLLDFI